MSLAAVETAIVDRLATTGVKVLAATSADDFEKVRAPAFVVVFDGLAVKDSASARDAAVAEAGWLVVAVSRNAMRPQDGAAARHGALDMLQDAFGALAGWQPAGAMRPLRFAGAQGVDFEPPAALLPLRFTCEVQLTKE
ncbi:hypothetical protein MOJ79_18115 [Calidifontimicrobium sp. SYSU G02091]|uniref:phage tail terminator protein n=1 Tax=Calidifontimicrobium sp. SYSU G02091 TaxID=2926421 RepID=UPI001F538C98|nr:hypothetical protein [Calidifontimicrobium sp. SYSU G02091]MCI1193751.1 hypothetical protein [Calidifontimicrobium sp. SYSU G02091]